MGAACPSWESHRLRERHSYSGCNSSYSPPGEGKLCSAETISEVPGPACPELISTAEVQLSQSTPSSGTSATCCTSSMQVGLGQPLISIPLTQLGHNLAFQADRHKVHLNCQVRPIYNLNLSCIMHKMSCYKLFTRKLPSGHIRNLVGHLKGKWAFAQHPIREQSTPSGCCCGFSCQDPEQRDSIPLHLKPLDRPVPSILGLVLIQLPLLPQIPELCSTFMTATGHVYHRACLTSQEHKGKHCLVQTW